MVPLPDFGEEVDIDRYPTRAQVVPCMRTSIRYPRVPVEHVKQMCGFQVLRYQSLSELLKIAYPLFSDDWQRLHVLHCQHTVSDSIVNDALTRSRRKQAR
jgi:hypothetical protein